MKKRSVFLNPISLFIIGLALGVMVRLFDIYTEHLGKMFSQMAIWILIGSAIAWYSPSAKKAMINILPFCLGMLITYYYVSKITDGVYSKTFITGWTIFAFCSPILAAIVWYSRKNGILSVIIRIGIVTVSLLSSVIVFHGPRFYDFIIDGVLVYLLFAPKQNSNPSKREHPNKKSALFRQI